MEINSISIENSCGMVGISSKMQKIRKLIGQLSKYNATVYILGESGTGKELVAKALHYTGLMKDGPFVSVNCGAFPETLLESELFGYVKGAFTGAEKEKKGYFSIADKGTIFLDEVCAMSQRLQVLLLRVLQDRTFQPLGDEKPRTVDVRVISASNINLEEMVKKKTFRKDTFYRLNVVKIVVPPLRERIEDIPLLVDHFVKNYPAVANKDIAHSKVFHARRGRIRETW